jgi:hypothetical protein
LGEPLLSPDGPELPSGSRIPQALDLLVLLLDVGDQRRQVNAGGTGAALYRAGAAPKYRR